MAEPDDKKRRKPERSSELEEAIRRFVKLAPDDQLALFAEVQEHLGELSGEEDARKVTIRRRLEALEALAEVARHLGLPDGQAPTVKQFEVTSKELGLEFSKSQVIRVWGKWRFASQAFVGGYLAYTTAQGTRKKQAEWYDRGNEEPIEALRRWLATKPPKETVISYDAWAKEQNREAKPGAPKLQTHPGVTARVGLPWADAIKVARGERTKEEARADPTRRLKNAGDQDKHFAKRWELRRDALKDLPDLISVAEVARLYGLGPFAGGKRTHQSGFPKPVQEWASGRLWLRDEVEAHLSGRNRKSADRERAKGLLQSDELAKRLGMKLTTMQRYVVLKKWFLVPPPSVKLARSSFWLEEEVVAWENDPDSPVP